MLQAIKSQKLLLSTILLSFILFILLAIPIKNGASFTIDEHAVTVVEAINSPILEYIMIGFTSLGSKAGIVSMFLLTLLLAGLIFRHYAPLLGIVITVIVGDFFNKMFKSIVGRDRPSINGEIDGVGHSFPSGHAMVSLAFYGFIAYLIILQLKKRSHKTIVAVSFSTMILLIGLSRVFLNVHFLTDVIGGFAIGFVLLGLTIFLVKKLSPQMRR